jgi:transposase
LGRASASFAKTDPLDARMLSLYRERAQPPSRPSPSPRQREMADLVRRRRQIIAMIVAEKSRLDTARGPVRRDIQTLAKILERRAIKLDTLVGAAIDGDPEQAAHRERLLTVPCVGAGIARTLIVELPELASLDRRQIAAPVGIAPFARDSGKKTGKRRIRAGRSAPRSALYLAAMNGARFNSVLKAFYDRLLHAGKPPKLAFIALARKLLTILNAMLRDRNTWREVTP